MEHPINNGPSHQRTTSHKGRSLSDGAPVQWLVLSWVKMNVNAGSVDCLVEKECAGPPSNSHAIMPKLAVAEIPNSKKTVKKPYQM